MDIVLILLGSLVLLCGGVLYFIADGNVRDFDYWWNNSSGSYKQMVHLRNVAIGAMVVGAILLLAGIITLVVRKMMEANRRQIEAAVGQPQNGFRLCPFCGQPAGTGKFCGQCGQKLPQADENIRAFVYPNTETGRSRTDEGTAAGTNAGTDAAVAKKGRVGAPFILLLCVLPAVDILNMLLNMASLLYRFLLYHAELPVIDIVSMLTSAGKAVAIWCLGLLPVVVLTAMRKIDPGRVRVRDVILGGIWGLSGLNFFHTFIPSLVARYYGSSAYISYVMAVEVKGKLSFSWLWPWLLLLVFLLVRSGTLRPTKTKFFVTAGLLAVWSLVLVILLPFLLGSVPGEAASGVEKAAEVLRIWLLGQWPDLPEAYAYARQYLQVWVCFVWLQYLVEIWFVAMCGEEKIRWSGLAFVLGLPLFTFFMTIVNLVVMQILLFSYPLAMGAGAVIGCIALIVIYIVQNSRSRAHT